MGTLWSELGPVAEAVADRPRVYADANVPSGLVSFMRETLKWDVLFVMEHPDLRRARDIEHYRLARQLRRTLITLDRDYLDDRVFPPQQGSGVLGSRSSWRGWTRTCSRPTFCRLTAASSTRTLIGFHRLRRLNRLSRLSRLSRYLDPDE